MKLKKRNQSKGDNSQISWLACIAFGVRNTKYNRARFANGEALDLIADTCLDEDIIKTRTKDD